MRALIVILAVASTCGLFGSAAANDEMLFSNGAQIGFPREDCTCVCSKSGAKVGQQNAVGDIFAIQAMAKEVN